MYVKINLYSLNKNKILVFYDSSRYGGNLHLWAFNLAVAAISQSPNGFKF